MSLVVTWKLLTDLEKVYKIKLRVPQVHACLYILQTAMFVPTKYKFSVPGSQGLLLEAYSDKDEYGTTLDIHEHIGPFSWFIYEPNQKGMFILANDSERFVKSQDQLIQGLRWKNILVNELCTLVKQIGIDAIPFFALCHYELYSGTNKEADILKKWRAPMHLGSMQRDHIISLAAEWQYKYIVQF